MEILWYNAYIQMKSFLQKIELETKKQFEIVDITDRIKTAVLKSEIKDGIATVFCPHTTASVRINHNEPLLMQDILKALYRLVPVDISYSHDLFELRENVEINERTNGHAHVKAFLLGSSENLIIKQGQVLKGEKQSIFFIEFDGGRKREVLINIMGE